jgi:hypothetical protein
MNKILKELKILRHEKENSVVKNLLKTPTKEPRDIMPHTNAPIENASHQVDLLFLPDDDGYKYLLVVVDIATRKVDAEPLKTKQAKDATKAMEKIYKRGILKTPLRLEVDSGKEFLGEFSKYFSRMLDVVKKIVGRHRQQSVVETKNFQIGKILNTRMLVEEINNKGVVSRSWRDIVPKVVKLLNKYFAHNPEEIGIDDPIKTNKFSSTILPVGTKVRYQLDNPVEYVNEKKLTGKFRSGDIRWSKTVHTITSFYLRPAQPPMYQLDDDTRVAYTKYQLQVVHENEVAPSTESQKKFTVQRLLRRYTDRKTKKVYFEVLWGDDSKSNEPRTSLMKDIPLMIEQFELKGSK